jgi:hypothetical protein
VGIGWGDQLLRGRGHCGRRRLRGAAWVEGLAEDGAASADDPLIHSVDTNRNARRGNQRRHSPR